MRHSSEDSAAKVLGQSAEDFKHSAKVSLPRLDPLMAKDYKLFVNIEKRSDSLLERRVDGFFDWGII